MTHCFCVEERIFHHSLYHRFPLHNKYKDYATLFNFKVVSHVLRLFGKYYKIHLEVCPVIIWTLVINFDIKFSLGHRVGSATFLPLTHAQAVLALVQSYYRQLAYTT